MNVTPLSYIRAAEALEAAGQLEEAAKQYEAAISHRPAEERPYQRLMIIYRKLKMPKQEQRVIKAGIAAFESIFRKVSKDKKLTTLSQRLMISSGLANKKGQPVFEPEPIATWKKRLQLLTRKIKGVKG